MIKTDKFAHLESSWRSYLCSWILLDKILDMVKIVRSQIICYSNYLVISEIIKVLEKFNHINSVKVMKDSLF